MSKIKDLLIKCEREQVSLLYTEQTRLPEQYGWQIKIEKGSMEYSELSEDRQEYVFFGNTKLTGSYLEYNSYEPLNRHIVRMHNILPVNKCLRLISENCKPNEIYEAKILKDLTMSYGVNSNNIPFIMMYDGTNKAEYQTYLVCFMYNGQINVEDDLRLTNRYIGSSLSIIENQLSKSTKKPGFVDRLVERESNTVIEKF